LLSPAEFKSLWNLLDPKWKGKIAMRDPLSAGGGLSVATFWYTHEGLGKDFIQKLFTQQEVVIVRDDRQILDFVAQGKQAIAIGTSHVLTNELIGKGLPLKHLLPDALKEGAYITAGNGTIVVTRTQPHPNALRLYVDYLLSVEGQLEWSRAARSPSLRRDVPKDHVPDNLVPKEGVQYQENHGEPYVKLRQEVTSFLRPLLAQRPR
jgi:iron(III) transport system substrate-binding protein